jgi:hypothetical protein
MVNLAWESFHGRTGNPAFQKKNRGGWYGGKEEGKGKQGEEEGREEEEVVRP